MLVDTLPLGLAPGVVIEQDASPNNTVLSPLADAIDVRRVRAVDVVEGDVVVEALGSLVGEVAQTVPLRAGLRVEGPDVVVDDARRLVQDLLVKGLAAEEGQVALRVEGPVEADAGRGGVRET